VPGAVSSTANSIDSAGDVVYAWTDSTGLHHGALCIGCASPGRKYHKFDDPKGADGTYGDGINDHGLIVGVYFTNGGATAEGFKATY